MTAKEWIKAFCDELGMPHPTDEQADEILQLAAVAAHASERIAAPIACWFAGASGKPLPEAIAVAEGIASGG